MSANRISYWLIRKQSAHFITVPPEDYRLLSFFAPVRKVAGQARFTNAWFATRKDDPPLPVTRLVKGTLHTGDFFFASNQFSLQNTVRIQLGGSNWLFGFTL